MKRFATAGGAACGLATLLLASAAGATQIQFLWQATGTNSITALPGQQLVLEAWVHAGNPGVKGVSVSSLATPGLLEAVGFEHCPQGAGNSLAGICGSAFGAELVTLGVNNIELNVQDGGLLPPPGPGLSGSFNAFATPANDFMAVVDESFVLVEITYLVLGLGAGEVLPFYRGGIDGVLTDDLDVIEPLAEGADLTSGVSLQVIPEPGSAALLALGVATLAAGARSARERR